MSPVNQRVLIERAARLMLYIEIMDRETLEAGTMSERNSRQYLAWTNSLRLTLRDLGLKAARRLSARAPLVGCLLGHCTSPLASPQTGPILALDGRRLGSTALPLMARETIMRVRGEPDGNRIA